MRAHVGMPASERHIDIEACPDMRHAVGQRRRNNGEMIELEHLPVLKAERATGPDSLAGEQVTPS